jgi:hypothetical protein
MRVGAHEWEAAQTDTNPTPEEYEQRRNTARSRVHESGGREVQLKMRYPHGQYVAF